MLNYKDKFPEGVAVWDIERGKASGIRQHYWQTDTSVSVSSWGFVEGKSDYKSARSLLHPNPNSSPSPTPTPTLTPNPSQARSLLHDLLDIVSKNGNLLLNVGPRGDGTIPPDAVTLLEQLGGWLRLHGEAV